MSVEVHIDHFEDDALDTKWLPTVAARGWVVLTNDQKIMRRAIERDALMRGGAAAFALVGGNAPALELAQNFVNTLEKVLDTLRLTPRPFIAKVYRPSPREAIAQGKPGTVEVKLTMDNWTPVGPD